MFKPILTAAVAAASLMSAPVMAQTNASKLSVVQARSGASVDGQKLFGGSPVLLAGIFFATLAALIVFEDDIFGDDEPASR